MLLELMVKSPKASYGKDGIILQIGPFLVILILILMSARDFLVFLSEPEPSSNHHHPGRFSILTFLKLKLKVTFIGFFLFFHK